MDLFHSWGVEVAARLQSEYSRHEAWFSLASAAADLHTAYFWLFPVCFHLRRDLGLRLVWVAVLGDWLNLVLKWVLFGERPYWWVHETRFYGKDPAPRLKQFPITCETGPGSPSGHAMGAAGVGYLLVTTLLSMAAERRCPPLLHRFLQIILWTLMVVSMLLVGASRVYMAAHFPHQVVSGLITGLLVAQSLSKVQWISSASMRRYLFTTVFLTSFAVGFYLLLKALGVDLLWTLEKAQKWCVRPEWVHMDSTPFASLLRNMGTLLGLGLGLHSPLYTHTRRSSQSVAFKAGCIAVSVALLQLLDGQDVSSQNQALFYALSFGKSAVAVFIPTAIVPGALSLLRPGDTARKNQ